MRSWSELLQRAALVLSLYMMEVTHCRAKELQMRH